VEVSAVQYPGRENRWGETPVSEAGDLAREIFTAIRPELERERFAFFGHSLGAMMAYEVARLLRDSLSPEPAHLFISSRRAPHLEPSPPVLNNLPDAEFILKMGTLNGTPEKVLQNRELMSLLLPMLRADFRLDETYDWIPGAPLQQNFSIYGAEADLKVPQAHLEAWSDYTTGAATLTIFPGGHFYLKDPGSQLFPAMSLELQQLIGAG
jgi:surfactin synthase thioesterase subunit